MDLRRVVEALGAAGVEFVLIGGLALIAHGGNRLTEDVDLCYARSPDNLRRLVNAVRDAADARVATTAR